jgi:large subunit ribosomal protein L15
MQIHELKPKHKNKGKKRVGRGGAHGTYSGRGMKGQKQRAGRKMVPIIRELIKRYPKVRGYRRYELSDSSAIVNLDVLDKTSKDGEIINPENLIKKGIVNKIKGKTPEVKILGKEKISKKLIIENCKISKTAKEAVVSAGGSIK